MKLISWSCRWLFVGLVRRLLRQTKDITEEEAKGKTDSQDMPNLPKCQNKTKRRKKKQSESAKGPLDVYFLLVSDSMLKKTMVKSVIYLLFSYQTGYIM
jgi:hypothetical protein